MIVRLLEEDSAEVRRFDTAPRSLSRSWKVRVTRIRRILPIAREVWVFGRREEDAVIYLSLSGGVGLVYEAAFAAVARFCGARVIVHHHSFRYIDADYWAMRLLAMAAGRKAIHVALSEKMGERLRRRYRGIDRIHVLSNAAFVSRSQEASLSKPPAPLRAVHSIRIGYLSNLSRAKGMMDFLSVAETCVIRGVSVEFVAAGPFEDRRAEEEFCERARNIASVTHIGPVYGVEKQSFFEGIDAFLFPTRYRNEAEPLVVLEALRVGLPVIAFGRGCIPELLQDDAGVCVEMGSDFAGAAADALGRWAADRVELARRKELARARFAALCVESERSLASLLNIFMSSRGPDSEGDRNPARTMHAPNRPATSLFVIRLSKLVYCFTHPECWPALIRGVSPSIEHKDVLKTLECDLLMDVGANRGQFSLMCRLLHPEIPIRAYEPQAAEAAVYRKVLAGEHGISLHEIALGDGAGTAKLHVSGRADSSSLLPIGKLQTELFPSTAEVATREVDVFTLDSLREHWAGAHRALLKLDVQGFELQVLRGAREALKRCAYVYAECSQVALYEGQALFSEVEAFLKDEGFIVSHRENEQWADGKLIQADYLFVRSMLKPERKEAPAGSASAAKSPAQVE